MLCPQCGSEKAWKNGRRNGYQRLLCRNCGHEYLDKHLDGHLSSSEHVQKAQPKSLSRSMPNLVLATEGEKYAERHIGVQGSKTKGEKMQVAEKIQNSGLLSEFPSDLRSKILEFGLKKLNKGKSEATVKAYLYNLRHLLRAGANLNDPESVEQVISRTNRWGNKTKSMLVTAYKEFLNFLGVPWEPPKYQTEQKIPFIPLEREIDDLIAGSGRTLSPFLQLLKESLARFQEAANLKWVDIDFERGIIAINEPKKHSKARVFKASPKLLNMLSKIKKKDETVFPKPETLKESFYRQRKRLAHKLQNPRILSIGFHTFRHFGATMLYHKTKDIVYVQQCLGHKNIRNTMIYITIEQTLFKDSDEFHSATAKNC